jgi:hypothetical protein
MLLVLRAQRERGLGGIVGLISATLRGVVCDIIGSTR